MAASKPAYFGENARRQLWHNASGVSQQNKVSLKSHVEATLFERLKTRLELTQAGQQSPVFCQASDRKPATWTSQF